MKYSYKIFEDACMEKLARCRVILDVGGGTRFMKGMKKYETLFAMCDYKTLDVSADYHPDIVGDIHAIPLPDASVDGVMCRSVLEHVERPADAIREIYRILKSGGFVFIEVPSTYPYHARTGFGGYPDYWRFFESSIRLMMKDFSEISIQKRGGWFLAMTYFMPGQARLRWMLDPFANICDRVFHTEKKTTTSFLAVLARK